MVNGIKYKKLEQDAVTIIAPCFFMPKCWKCKNSWRFLFSTKEGMNVPRTKQIQTNVEIKPDMKVLLELEQTSGTDGLATHISLGSHVEEVMPDGCFLIKMPIHKGYHYPLPKHKPILIYLFAQSRMYSLTVLFVERVKRDNLMYAKVRQLSDIKSNQRRDCFRLLCSLPISAERPAADDDEKPPPFCGKMLNLSDGGLAFVTKEAVKAGEILTLTFNIGTVEIIEAKIRSVEKIEGKEYRYKASVKFIHKCKLQKDYIYKYIVEQQLEILRKVGTESHLL